MEAIRSSFSEISDRRKQQFSVAAVAAVAAVVTVVAAVAAVAAVAVVAVIPDDKSSTAYQGISGHIRAYQSSCNGHDPRSFRRSVSRSAES